MEDEDLSTRAETGEWLGLPAEKPEHDIQNHGYYYTDYNTGHHREIEREAGPFNPNISGETSERQS